MPDDKFTLNHDAAIQSLNRYTRREPCNLVRLTAMPRLFDVLLRVGGITNPNCVSIVADEHGNRHQWVRFIVRDHRQSPAIGVTQDYEAKALTTAKLHPEEVAGAIQNLLDIANDLLSALDALRLGKERVEQEVDYSDPRHLIDLLEDRGCTVRDREAVTRLVTEDPGPLYYGDIDLSDDGTDWSNGGGPWADRAETRLLAANAIECP
jgi:hypothetical protein